MEINLLRSVVVGKAIDGGIREVFSGVVVVARVIAIVVLEVSGTSFSII